ncbi:hypothetical protein PCC9214_00517 [Planktothrix tepida]|uniref:Uncharacterized protein n=2 Tax=Planktothrix TaxID=54304 RepID=A0A1J1LDZ0_9CYAN|nr:MULTISPECIES: hypothetical protein [Planktothrix]CAD5918734.1 hypothetical protein PCC9214_00517 [Planktothrix tepida]CAD5984474.1 hypothetical protein NO713_05284 [Planktothrix pseudagardhii]CUR30807.1 exported hypothetical protein [Planktothrix tepida PCC 9214]
MMKNPFNILLTLLLLGSGVIAFNTLPIPLGISASVADPSPEKELGLGEFRLGDLPSKLDVLGTPLQILKHPPGNYNTYARLVYPNLIVDIGDEKIVVLTTTDSSLATPDGVRVGDSLNRVFEVYGQQELHSQGENQVVSYSFSGGSYLYFKLESNRIIEISCGFLPD